LYLLRQVAELHGDHTQIVPLGLLEDKDIPIVAKINLQT
jgi:hypothetical protein